jgi:tetratricopeptide (TPR) repeat protein
MKKLLIFFIFLFFTVGFLYAKENSINTTANKELYKQAIHSYKTKDYHSAVKNYNILISAGIKNSDIYYNLALSYIGLGEYGKSSLNIERALKISPRDKDVRKLKRELSKIIKEPKENIAEKIISQMKLIGSLNEMTIVLFTIFFAICIFISLYCFYYKKTYIKIALILFIFLWQPFRWYI